MTRIGDYSFTIWKLAALALLVTACGRSAAPRPVESGNLSDNALYRVIDDEVGTLDPHKVSSVTDIRVATDLFEGLTTFGYDGRIAAGLAESWEASPSAMQWRFRLRPLATFSDGSPINAEDVVSSLRRSVDPKTAAPMARLLGPILNADAIIRGEKPPESLGVSAIGRTGIQVQLSRPAPELMELLAHPVASVVPVRSIAALGDNWSRAEGLVTSGPYVVARRILHATLELERNSKFHGAGDVRLGKIYYYPISDRDAAIRKFRAGEVDIVQEFNRTQLELVQREKPKAVRIADYRGTYYWVFNTRKPPFDSKAVRCALSMAVDRDIIAHQVTGMGNQPSFSIVPATMPGYGGPVVPEWARLTPAQKQQAAISGLASAGYGPDKPLKFEARFNSSDDHKRVALALAQMWKRLGVDMSLFNTEASVHFAALKSGDFAFARSGWIADYNAPDSFLGIYHSSAGVMNYSGFKDQAFDRAYDAALGEADPARRIALLRAAEQIAADACVVIPLFGQRTHNLVSTDVHGWNDNFANINPSRYLSVARSPAP